MNQADTAWMLVSTALVLLMTPMLAFFYGGLVRSKNALNTMMMSFIALGFSAIIWALLAYSLAFAPGNDWIGGMSRAMLSGVGIEPVSQAPTIPHVLYMCYQATFAVITAALISGSIVERMRFSAYLVFISLWGVIVYAPIAHWVWGGGWLFKMGALDFAGGTVVHVNAAMAAIACVFAVGKRSEYPSSSLLPHNVPFTLLGAGVLWFGWFGFNAGSALAANGIAGLAFTATFLAPAATLVVWTFLDYLRSGKPTAVGAATAIVVGLVAITPAAGFVSPMSALAANGIAGLAFTATFLAPAATLVVWTFLDYFRSGKPTAVGAATAIVVGLVAITPAAGFVSPMSAILLGGIAAIPSYLTLQWRARTNFDDSLDVLAAHGVGGTVGALLTGVFAQKAFNGVADGLLYGNPGQLGIQATAVAAAAVYSFVVSFALVKIIGLVIPLRPTAEDEMTGLDISQHGEEAYLLAD